MATNLALDPELLERAYRVSGAATKKAAVTQALEEFIARHEQRHITELFGTWSGTTPSITRQKGTGSNELAG